MTARTIIGPFWVEKCRYQSRSEALVQRGRGMEEHHPWRYGDCRILRIPLTRHALAVGRWSGMQTWADLDGEPVLVLRSLGEWKQP
jgi:hypothetical protein